MSNLLTRADFNGDDFKYLTINLNNNEIDAHINEAQRLDLRPFLGLAFYTELVKLYPDDGKYSDLVNGVDYNYCGDNVHFDGLKPAILYYAYARYILNQDAVSTPFGLVTKTNEFSTQLSTKSVQMKIDNARSSAQAYIKEAERFLCEKAAEYPLWCGHGKKRKGGAIISVVDKNQSTPKSTYKDSNYR